MLLMNYLPCDLVDVACCCYLTIITSDAQVKLFMSRDLIIIIVLDVVDDLIPLWSC
jgi:hypothetical protein